MATETDNGLHLSLHSSADIVIARQRCRSLAEQAGFSHNAVTLIATAVSEIARNVLEHAGGGEMRMALVGDPARPGIEIVAVDQGPGIADVDALLGADGLDGAWRPAGIGLPGARSLMDEFEIVSAVGQGTTVTMKKWMVEP
jgi:anti-sigma regulatory factor (Ser/Thr protein kinase)